MPRAKPAPETPLREHWRCEGCDTVFAGVNPPDVCPVCEHNYFENCQDEQDARDRLH